MFKSLLNTLIGSSTSVAATEKKKVSGRINAKELRFAHYLNHRADLDPNSGDAINEAKAQAYILFGESLEPNQQNAEGFPIAVTEDSRLGSSPTLAMALPSIDLSVPIDWFYVHTKEILGELGLYVDENDLVSIPSTHTSGFLMVWNEEMGRNRMIMDMFAFTLNYEALKFEGTPVHDAVRKPDS